VWSDEFDGPALNGDNWLVEIGARGWGNNEPAVLHQPAENLRLEEHRLRQQPEQHHLCLSITIVPWQGDSHE
jgi:hypothetical protein